MPLKGTDEPGFVDKGNTISSVPEQQRSIEQPIYANKAVREYVFEYPKRRRIIHVNKGKREGRDGRLGSKGKSSTNGMEGRGRGEGKEEVHGLAEASMYRTYHPMLSDGAGE